MSGGKKYTSPTGKGVDVSSVRMDDLDRACLQEIEAQSNPMMLDLGCGLGGFSRAAAAVGAQVTAVDQFDFFAEFASHEEIIFVQGELQNLSTLVTNSHFDIVYSQRTWHYLSHDTALATLQWLKGRTDKLCISVTGLSSEAGVRYAHANRPIQERFTQLDLEIAEKLQIREPVCLYTKEEFETLLKTAGFNIERLWESAFGNIKTICS